VRYAPDAAQIAALEQDFVGRSRYLARTDEELEGALEALAAAERKLGRLRGPTLPEAARELARTKVPYNARIVVAVACGESVPYCRDASGSLCIFPPRAGRRKPSRA